MTNIFTGVEIIAIGDEERDHFSWLQDGFHVIASTASITFDRSLILDHFITCCVEFCRLIFIDVIRLGVDMRYFTCTILLAGYLELTNQLLV